MPERVEFGVPVAALQGATEPGDRFVYSYWFAGLSNRSADGRPVLTKPQWIYLAKAAGLDGELVQQWESWHTDNPAAAGRESALPALGHTYRSVRAEERADPYDAVLRRPEPDLLLELARSEVGLLFLDRTRLRPAGFVVGEHLHTLGLAPAEEVVLEQRSFYQREQLAETATEAEETGEQEGTEARNEETSELIAGTTAATRTGGFTAGGSVGFSYAGATVGVQGGESQNTTEADNDTKTDSVKQVHARTAKNTAKLRDLHKTVIRISATDRFERSARRTVRNPNAHTPIDLHWFKVLQRIRFSHERYGVRLCWSPFVKDPAGAFFHAEQAKREELLARARSSVPPVVLPPQPVVAGVPGSRVVGLAPPLTELPQWGGWPGSDMSADYPLPINVPVGMKWDGDAGFVHASLRPTLTGQPRAFAVHPVGDPWEVVNDAGERTIFQIVHAGAAWRLTGSSQLWVSMSARVIPDATSLAAEQAAAVASWEATCAARQAERAAQVAVAEAQALAEFEVWRAAHRTSLNPAHETIRQFIGEMFPPDARDEVAELDVWYQVFDWELATARRYPGTWSGDGQLRDPALSADDFVNASWARLYLPVRPGFEELALRWILLRSRTGTGPPNIETFISRVVKDLAGWREQHLGGPAEVTVEPVPGQPCPDVVQRYTCLGSWTEDVPTDGVHLEVTQATSSAGDQLSADLAAAAAQQAAALGQAVQAGARLAGALADGEPGQVAVHLHLPGPAA
jgi:hypothetical protein